MCGGASDAVTVTVTATVIVTQQKDNSMNTLKNKTILITGSTRGIGEAMALRFAKDGANLIITGKTVEKHEKLPGTIYSVAEAVEKAGGTITI